jgi:hypothetical protein
MASGPASSNDQIGIPQIGLHYEEAPHVTSGKIKSWYVRGENYLSAYSEAEAGGQFERKDQPDEFMILLPDAATELAITWNGATTNVKGNSVVFVPPGHSVIDVKVGGRISQWFTTKSEDLVKLCANSEGYVHDPYVAAFEPWPDPPAGFKVRAYSLDVPRQEGRLGRVFRCTTFMTNVPYVMNGPRDITKMSPHSHDDHQQCSLITEGNYTHHMRWPWGIDKRQWLEDDHAQVGAPSVTFIPCRVIHTSECTGAGANQLTDIFCPPRADFSKQAGWVLNADDYPAKPGI